MTYYDDNYGFYEGMDDPDMREFYLETQKKSVWKTCADCGKRVKIKPEYDCCNACADRRERGW